MDKIVLEFQNRKEYLHKEINLLKNISCFEPGGAFYAFPNISKTGLNGQEFADIALEEKGVALVLELVLEIANDFVRISFANSLKILKAITRISTI